MSIFHSCKKFFNYSQNFSAPKLLVLGYSSYVIMGFVLLCIPWSMTKSVSGIDNLFTSMSAVSTTGLTTVDVGTNYTLLGQIVIMILIQIGGIGYMTFSSFVLLTTSHRLSEFRNKITKATFPLPKDFNTKSFVIDVIVFTFICELIGAIALYFIFSSNDIKLPFWSAIFHSVSAFCTAGFSLFPTSFEMFKNNFGINIIISILSLFGGIGFIVFIDLWENLTGKRHQIRFTSKVILSITFWFIALGTILFFIIEPSIQEIPASDRLLTSFFQVMSASTTVGFNTIAISKLSAPIIFLLIVVMIFGASPAGTGGGLKSTTLSALIGLVKSTLKGRNSIRFLKRDIPKERLQIATASFIYYMMVFSISVFLLLLSEKKDLLPVMFEAASALGTVGLSMGITAELSVLGKINIIILMLMGRVGILTFGVAISPHDESKNEIKDNDLVL